MSTIAVFDVGKTNKKILLYDESFQIIHEVYEQFEADESGPVHREPLEASAEWFADQLKMLAGNFDIRAVSVTTHGATCVYLDADGKPALPVVAYTTPAPADFEQRFYDQYGNERDLHRELATPNLAMANLAKSIAFVQETYPAEFKNVRHILNFPQYFSYLLTGKMSAETTYVGCHSYLMDFNTLGWSDLIEKMGIRKLLPAAVGRPGDVVGTVSESAARRTGLAEDTVVVSGIHDSNASLLPFLVKEKGRFILNSTGTWCVAMCPSAYRELTEDEIDLKIFYNCDAFGTPVKTGNFMGGQERTLWMDIIQRISGQDGVPDYDPETTRRTLEDKRCFILPGVMPGTGPFPASTSRIISDGTVYGLNAAGMENSEALQHPALGYAYLNISLALQSYEMIKGVGAENGMPIYVEGGFRKNDAYCALLTALFPHSPILRTNMKEATALGAAILAKAALENKDPKALADIIPMEIDPVPSEPFPRIWSYREAFLKQLA